MYISQRIQISHPSACAHRISAVPHQSSFHCRGRAEKSTEPLVRVAACSSSNFQKDSRPEHPSSECSHSSRHQLGIDTTSVCKTRRRQHVLWQSARLGRNDRATNEASHPPEAENINVRIEPKPSYLSGPSPLSPHSAADSSPAPR